MLPVGAQFWSPFFVTLGTTYALLSRWQVGAGLGYAAGTLSFSPNSSDSKSFSTDSFVVRAT